MAVLQIDSCQVFDTQPYVFVFKVDFAKKENTQQVITLSIQQIYHIIRIFLIAAVYI